MSGLSLFIAPAPIPTKTSSRDDQSTHMRMSSPFNKLRTHAASAAAPARLSRSPAAAPATFPAIIVVVKVIVIVIVADLPPLIC
jgi:hypothetical protein